MIKISKLSKCYNKKEGFALKNVSFTLPDKGFIFIVGKSGSGKSTLLNLLGGLDGCTSGEIIVDGNNITELQEYELENYRNSYIGFVFQDYCLFENLTISENIELALKMQNVEPEEKVEEIIKKVELNGFEDNVVSKLSGGQKQRCAIARALIKKPKLILADEPTGNLDSKTSEQILNLLKNLSKTHLIVLISHNIDDAYKYGDRIIELSDGRIVNDIENVGSFGNDLIIDDKQIIIPRNRALTREELEKINSNRKTKEIKQHIAPPKENSPDIEFNSTKTEIPRSRVSNGCYFKYLNHLKPKPIIKTVFISIVIALVIFLLGICQSFTYFSSTHAIEKGMVINSLYDTIIMQKGYIHEFDNDIVQRKLGHVSDEDLEAFSKINFEGNIYKLYKYSIPTKSSTDDTSLGNRNNFSITSADYFIDGGRGVLVCDEDYLKSIYKNKDGELEYSYIAPEQRDGGIIITDYLADAIISHNLAPIGTESRYSDINSQYSFTKRFYINAVVKTNYSIRYLPLFGTLYEALFISKTPVQEAVKQNYEEISIFINEVNNYLAIGYSFNPDFAQATIDDYMNCCQVTRFENLEILENNNVVETNSHMPIAVDGSTGEIIGVEDGTIIMPLSIYNEVFNTKYTESNKSTAPEKQITLSLYNSYRETQEDPHFTKTYTAKMTDDNIGSECIVSENDFKELRANEISVYALYFDNLSKNYPIYKTGTDNAFYINSDYIDGVETICKVHSVINTFIIIIVCGLFAVAFLLLVIYGRQSITSKSYEIGVVKALGGKNRDINAFFITKMVLIGLIVAIVSFLTIFISTPFIDGLIIDGFSSYLEIPNLNTIKVINFYPITLLFDLIAFFAVTIISLIIPLISANKTKPMEILKAKE